MFLFLLETVMYIQKKQKEKSKGKGLRGPLPKELMKESLPIVNNH